MALVNFTNLDFDQIKTSIKDYLRSNSNFTDYDFEGSNLSIILDILAYNTYISSYNANMISNEVFIDSATLRENVVSIARSIGYVPRSTIASKASVSLFVDTVAVTSPQKPLTLALKKGIIATSASTFGTENYVYSIPDDITVPVVNGIAEFNDFQIYEGTYITETYTVNSLDPNQRYILNNENIDTSLIRVEVKDSQVGQKRKYLQANDILSINSESRVFFIQEIEDQRYEILFGDGTFGKKLITGNIIEISYIVTRGPVANGVSSFTFNGTIVDNNGLNVTSGISLISTNISANGGKEIESVESIKKYATRVYASQNRAVTAGDYEVIIPKIYPEAESVSAFGGEDLDPPQYGKVFITIKPENGFFVPNSVKDNIKEKLKKYSVAGIIPEIMDLKYLFLEINSSVYYNANLAPSQEYIINTVSTNINKYANSTELNRYGARFKYSKFLKIIDDSHESITSNITKVQMRRDLRPVLNSLATYEICFGNQFHVYNMNGFNIRSSGFKIPGVQDTVYISDTPDSTGLNGKIFLFKLDSGSGFKIVDSNAGTIDYSKGEINLDAINVLSTTKNAEGESIIEISAIPESNDVIGLQDLYLNLNINNVNISVVSDKISSGEDLSGSSYTKTTSYVNESIVRV
ncbi:hypothetical protein EB169_02540 [archaeon]|nr:hypothetical protein [archaeon]